MNVQWWSCLFGLLCMHTEGARWTASQSPASIRRVEINSSLEISCSTSQPSPLALSLRRLFKADVEIVYLSLNDGKITRQNPRADYDDRVRVTRVRSESEYQVTLQLTKLKQDDTDLYYCRWTYMEKYTMEYLRSNGTVLVVGEKIPETKCQIPPQDLVLVCGGSTALVLILSFCGVRLYRGRRTKGNFEPVSPTRTGRPHSIRSCSCNSPTLQNQPYLITSLQSPYLNR